MFTQEWKSQICSRLQPNALRVLGALQDIFTQLGRPTREAREDQEHTQ